jgi:predicted PurR-regulated permease PerM
VLGLDRRAAQYAWTAVFILLLAVLVYLIRETLFIFAVALLFAYLLWPLVKFLDRRIPGRSKVWALAIVYLSLVALLVIAGIFIGTRIAEQATAFASRVPDLLAKLQQPPPPLASPSLQTFRNTVLAAIQKLLSENSQNVMSLVSRAIFGVLSHAGSLIFIVLVPILSFFFLKDGEAIGNSVLGIVTAGPRRDAINEVADELNVLFAQYMRALVLLATVAFIAYASFFSLIGVPYGVLLAAIDFPLEFIPMVGPLTGAAIILVVAGLGGFHHMLWIIAFLAAFRIFQDYILSPRVLSEGMELHPLLVIFGVLAGGSIAGVAGSFISVPVLATLRIIFRQLQKTRRAARTYTAEVEIDREVPNPRP